MMPSRPLSVTGDSLTLLEKNPVDLELADFWFWLPVNDRRVLCAAGHVDVANVELRWPDISSENRVKIIRGMNGLAQLAMDCAVALSSAREQLNKHARSEHDRA